MVMRPIINNIPDSIYVKEPACRKIIANLVDVRNMGLQSEAEVLGKNDFDVFPEELAEGFFADDQMVLRTGQPVLNREECLINAKGDKRSLLTTERPTLDLMGQRTGLTCLGQSI